MAKEKKLTFDESLKELEKGFGKGTVMGFSDKNTTDYDIISTGSIAFDNALGIGGFALGKLYELMGWEGTGKSTICGHLVANAQKKFPDKKVVYIDAEHALDVNYFRKLGVDINKMYIAQPTNGEEGFEIAKQLIKSGEVSLCILDSDTTLKPKSEVEGEIGDSSIGKKARLNSQAYPILHSVLVENNTCVVAISQFREKIGIMFGSPVTTSGGHGLKFTADVRIEISKTLLKEDDETFGSKVKVKITKNKMAPPFKAGEFVIRFGIGMDKKMEIIDLGNELEVIKKWGQSITYNESKYTVEQFEEALDNEEFRGKIAEEISKKLKDGDQTGK